MSERRAPGAGAGEVRQSEPELVDAEAGRQALQALCELSAEVAVGEAAAVTRELKRAARVCTGAAIEEVLLQAYLFVGFPATLAALSLWRDLGAVEILDTDPLAEARETSEWTDRGEDVCRIVYGDSYDRLRRNVHRIHPALDRWMITEGYGKVLGRPELDLAAREVCIVAMLAATGREPQLRSHLHGALNAGARREDVEAALRAGLDRSHDLEWQERAVRLWGRVRERTASGLGDS